MTTGEMMVYGGIGLIAVGVLGIFLCVPIFAGQRKRLEKKIKENYI